jgi:hypothetical protein
LNFLRYLRLPRYLATFLMVVVAAAIFLATTFFFGGGFGGGLLAIPLFGGLALYMLTILGLQLYRLVQQRDRESGRQAAVAVAVLLVSPIIFFPTFWACDRLCLWGTFAAHYRGYQHVIALSEQSRLPPPGKTAFQIADNGTEFQAERDGLKRVAFPLPGGFLNNWRGIMYDPQGLGKHPPRRQKDGRVADLLADWYTIENCTPMTARFFLCAFS